MGVQCLLLTGGRTGWLMPLRKQLLAEHMQMKHLMCCWASQRHLYDTSVQCWARLRMLQTIILFKLWARTAYSE